MMSYRLPIAVSVLTTGLLLAVVPSETQGNGNVYVSRFWHNHQPIYWPEWNGNGSETERVQYAWDSIVLKPGQEYGTGQGHPDNNLTDIFGKQDRVAAYQGRPRDALNSIGQAGGMAMSYSGSLIDNVRNLGGANQLGYGSGWWDGNRQARNWTTPSGGRRLDLVGFTYHHSLGAVMPKSVLRKEIQMFKQAYWKAWDAQSDLSDHSKGFFPTEMAFTTEMIDVLVDEGYEWSIVASHHLSRTCPTYNNQADPEGSWNIFSSPPNKADQLGPSPTSGWWYDQPNPGQGAWNVAPYAYQLHRAKYVNPTTGAEKSMVMVPSDDVLSYVAGYSGAQIGLVDGNISPHATDPSRPVIVLPSTDGDNAWGGGFDSWMVSTPGFFGAAQNNGYNITSIQDFVDAHPPPPGQYAHIEPGAWIFPTDDYGSPYFLKWVEPPLDADSLTRYPGTIADLETPGFALKFWSYAPIMAGANWCETAEQIYLDENASHTVEAWKIQAPYDWNGSYSSPNIVERAWHIYLAGLDSGFNYFGGLGNDDEVKPSLGTARAVALLDSYVSANLANDATPPSVFKPQRFPWNPGGYTFGWFNRIPGVDERFLKEMPSEFYVWTHAYDVSGVSNVTLKVRLDTDGVNTLANNQNETYAGGPDVSAWTSIAMTMRDLPNTQSELNAAADNGQIDYFITSPEIADYYFAKITDSSLPGFRGRLIDYYIEAVDNRGNVHQSDIQHVFVEDDGIVASPVTFSPSVPRDCDDLTVTYDSTSRVLSNANPVTMTITFDAWASSSNVVMSTSDGGATWSSTLDIPALSTSASLYFHDGMGLTDNNGGNDWSIGISDCNTGPSTVTVDPPIPTDCTAVSIVYRPNEGPLQTVDPVYIHIGRDGWLDVETPDPVMALLPDGSYQYTYSPPPGTIEINCAFNDGGSMWDNNGGADWNFAVSNCAERVTVDPVLPQDCDRITITYDNTIGPLTGAAPVKVWLQWNGTSTPVAPDMTLSNSLWQVSLFPASGDTNLTFYFLDGLGATDGLSTPWNLPIAPCATGTLVCATEASPVLTADPPVDQNNVDDNFDLDTLGGAAGTTVGAGFGSFGNIYVNYDAANLYLGGTELDPAGNNNGIILFLGVDTLANDAIDVRSQSGAPQGLDILHNLNLVLPADIAILLGDEFGDGTFTAFGLEGGGEFGQGVFQIDAASFSAVAGAELSQFDGTGTTPTGAPDADGNRATDRWEASIPWSSLGASGISNLTSITLAGIIAGGESGNNRFLSGNYLGSDMTPTAMDGGNVGFNTMTLTGIDICLGDNDADGDGLDDDWEIQYFGSITNGFPGIDTDGDGHLNEEELWLGTNPLNVNSALIHTSVGRNGGSGFTEITWKTVGQKTYMIQFSDDLALPGSGFSNATSRTETDVPAGIEADETYIDDYSDTGGPPTGPMRHYRVLYLP